MPDTPRNSGGRLPARSGMRPPSPAGAMKPMAGAPEPKTPLMRPAPASSQSLLQARSTNTKPTAPPVYRPQQIQRKQITHQHAASGPLFQPGAAPKVYHPKPLREIAPVVKANSISMPGTAACFPPVQLRRGGRGGRGGRPADPWTAWNDWAYIRGHFAAYGADQDSIAWLQVAQKERFRVPPKVGHKSRTGGKDYADQHVLGPLRGYINELKESLKMTPGVPERQAGKLSYWKRKHNIA